ncbi:hypothetical protein LKD70_16270 [Ruminococcus sp. CLA-AA-H200]|uniref:Uncharacterized protein n=1 Tax=Ruminococcus turbiniformis TaxID=2881258 RepID=A0ABS8G0V9_9FIRM|nr:hypothetical protein [Ruminococcus turbiniformis]MCC2255948.1 hypothetical protein [Ruminococcus turbiniformis]
MELRSAGDYDMIIVHVSFDLVDNFVSRVPEQRVVEELKKSKEMREMDVRK